MTYDAGTQAADKQRGLLFHYTDAAGLLGIIDHPSFPPGYDRIERLGFDRVAKFMASDVRYMNDREEMRYAGRVFAERFRLAADQGYVRVHWSGETIAISEEHAAILREAASEFERDQAYGEPGQVFAVCVSREGDLLSQWRGYGGGTGGYAIGFDREVLHRHTHTMPIHHPLDKYSVGGVFIDMRHVPGPVELMDVVYDSAEAQRLADEEIAWLARMEVRADTEFQGGTLWDLRWKVLTQLARFKNPGFAEEQEVRIVAGTSGLPHAGLPAAHAEFRPGRRAGIVPFWTLAVNLDTGPPTPVWGGRPDSTIERLVVGPGPEQHLRVSAARQLLHTNGHNPDVVVASELPFTG